jgi:hypothetical protein
MNAGFGTPPAGFKSALIPASSMIEVRVPRFRMFARQSASLDAAGKASGTRPAAVGRKGIFAVFFAQAPASIAP